MSDKRNYGIDLLRIVAMFFVVILHSLGRGGVLANAAFESHQYKAAWLLEITAYCAVDIFALISGYVSYSGKEKRTRYSNYIVIWLQTVFYGLVITGVYAFLKPGAVTADDFVKALFPVTDDLYWYLTAYTALFVIMPFLNAAILRCSETTLRKLFLAIIAVFSVFGVFFNRFSLSGGYSFIWITLLYILGAIIKKCNIGKNVKPWHAFIGIFILIVITYLQKIYSFEFEYLAINIKKGLLVSYYSPTVLGMAVLLVIGVSKINFHSVTEKIIGFFAPAAFSVYLLNNQRFIWDYFMKDRFVYLSTGPVVQLVLTVLSFALVFVAASMLIDRLRILLFKLLHIKTAAEFTEKKINKAISAVSVRI